MFSLRVDAAEATRSVPLVRADDFPDEGALDPAAPVGAPTHDTGAADRPEPFGAPAAEAGSWLTVMQVFTLRLSAPHRVALMRRRTRLRTQRRTPA